MSAELVLTVWAEVDSVDRYGVMISLLNDRGEPVLDRIHLSAKDVQDWARLIGKRVELTLTEAK